MFRESCDKVIFVQHINKQLCVNTKEWEIDDRVSRMDEDQVFEKKKGNAFISIPLLEFLDDHGITDIIVCGLVTHGCVYYTCKGGVDNELNISLLKGAHTCWNTDAYEKIVKTEKSLKDYGVNVIDISHI